VWQKIEWLSGKGVPAGSAGSFEINFAVSL
jgi:hypothetical protein